MVFVSGRRLELRVAGQGVSQLGQEDLPPACKDTVEEQESCGLLFVTKAEGDTGIPTGDQ